MLPKTRSVLAKAAALIAHRGGRGHCGGFGGSGHMGGFGGAPTEGRGSPSAGQNQKARRLMLVSIVRAVLVIFSFRVSDRRRSPAASCRDRGTCSSPHLRASSTYFALSASTYCASALPCASSNCATHDWLAATHIWVRAVRWSQVARLHSGGFNNTSLSHVDSRPRPS